MKNTEKNNVGVSFIHRRKILRIYSLQKLFFMQVFVNPIISCEIWPYTSFIPDKTRKHKTSNIAKKHATENVHIVNFLFRSFSKEDFLVKISNYSEFVLFRYILFYQLQCSEEKITVRLFDRFVFNINWAYNWEITTTFEESH